jgi:hypothetical protein
VLVQLPLIHPIRYMDPIRYAYPIQIRYDKLSYPLPVHITLTQPIPLSNMPIRSGSDTISFLFITCPYNVNTAYSLFGILYLLDNRFYTYPISSLFVYYRYSVVYLSVMLTDPLSLTALMYIASDTASDYSVSYLQYINSCTSR